MTAIEVWLLVVSAMALIPPVAYWAGKFWTYGCLTGRLKFVRDHNLGVCRCGTEKSESSAVR